MTYRQLLETLQQFSGHELDQNVTIHNAGIDEYYPASGVLVASDENGVLDEGHLYLEIKG